MDFFIFFFKKLIFKPSEKMYHNLFFIKLNIHLLSLTLLYPHIFVPKLNTLKVKIFKFTLSTFLFKYLSGFVIIAFIFLLTYFYI